MDHNAVRGLINYRFFLEQSRINQEIESNLKVISTMFKRGRIPADIAANSCIRHYSSGTARIIKARLQVEKDVRERTGLLLEDQEAYDLTATLTSAVAEQEKSLQAKLKSMGAPPPAGNTMDHLVSQLPAIVRAFQKEIRMLNLSDPSETQTGEIHQIPQLRSSIQKNLAAVSEPELNRRLRELTLALESLDLQPGQMFELLEIVEGLAQQAGLPPAERRQGIINSCFQRLKTILEAADKYPVVAGLVIQAAAVFTTSFPWLLDLVGL
ncbi:MAG: hypothetical protein HPY50_08455 [Firmicutes bacterium]|nr:hypothetical protein [Bacillota bacterium]